MAKRQINQRVEEDMLARIEARAKKIGIARNEWIERALDWALSQPETDRPKTIKERV
jgi:predicted HicB family RNase H-like nuclease